MLNDFIDYINRHEAYFVIIALLLVPFVHRLIFALISNSVADENENVKKAVLVLKRPTLFLILVIALSSGIAGMQLSAELIETLKFYLSIAGIVSFAWLLLAGLAALRLIVLAGYDINSQDNLKARRVYTQIKILERILTLVIIIVATGVILMKFEAIRQVGVSLLASAGIAGIIIGVAAQKVIGNILAGFQIAITQPIRIEDVVIVENEWGVIEEITLTYVVVRIWDKRRLVVPTPYFIEKPFQNWTKVSSDILGTVFLHTDYRMPTEPIRDELTKILAGTQLWDGKVNVLQVTNATDRTVELRALMSAKDSPTAWDLRVHVREQLIRFIQEAYPQYLPQTRIRMNEE